MKKKKINLDIFNEQYSFRSEDYPKRVMITPRKFLKTTYKEQQLNAIPRREEEIFNEKYFGKKTIYPTKVYKNFNDYLKGIFIRKNVEGIKNVFLGKKKSKYGIPIPFLEKDLRGYPMGHEGRHTAKALEELGIKKIPVTILNRKKLRGIYFRNKIFRRRK